ncbi:MAG TPA: polysaccharide biosynthesis protein [bacterium]|nr:polysaccharide biosynthesis protein [bacterium]
MRESLKRLTKHSAVYGIGHIVSRSMGFLLLPIHTNTLSPDLYGIASLLFSALAILNVFFSYGLDSAFLRFFVLAGSESEKRRLFSTGWWTIFSTSLLFSSLLVFFSAPFSALIFRSPDYTLLIRLAAGILIADGLALLPFLLLRAEEKSRLFVVLKTLNLAVTLGLNILFVGVLRLGVPGIFQANLIASAFTLLTLIPIQIQWLRPVFHRIDFAELMKFGLPYIPSYLSVVVMDQVSRFFIDRMIGTEATGLFSAGYKLGMFMALVVAAFRFAWHPFFLSTSRQPDAKRIFARILTYFLLVLGLFFLLVSFFVREIAGLRLFGFRLFGEGFDAGLSIVPIVMLAYILYGVYANFVIGVYLEKKSVYMPLITGLGAAAALLGNYFLIPRIGLTGAAWATAISYGVMALSLYLVNQRLYPIPYEGRRILKLLFVYAGIFFIGYGVLRDAAFWIRGVLILSVFPGLWIVRFFYAEERAALLRVFSRIGRSRPRKSL